MDARPQCGYLVLVLDCHVPFALNSSAAVHHLRLGQEKLGLFFETKKELFWKDFFDQITEVGIDIPRVFRMSPFLWIYDAGPLVKFGQKGPNFEGGMDGCFFKCPFTNLERKDAADEERYPN